ncbi:MAG: hypothetical protein M1308_02550, partial [Actinobacteria bacterium]|nr:hypothetical protein [Actinomycetota bacterium]
ALELTSVIIPIILATDLGPTYDIGDIRTIRFSKFTNTLIDFVDKWIDLPSWIIILAVLIGSLVEVIYKAELVDVFKIIIISIVSLLVIVIVITYICIIIEKYCPPIKRHIIKKSLEVGLEKNKAVL